MSSSRYEQTLVAPYIHKINLSNNNNNRTRRRPPKICLDCKEAIDCINLLSNKVNKIEKTIENLKNIKNIPKKKQLSTFKANFTLNNIPCELEYDLSTFTLENLQKLVIFTTKSCTSSISNKR